MLVVKKTTYVIPDLEYFRDTLGWAVKTEKDVLHYILPSDLIDRFSTYKDTKITLLSKKRKKK